MDKNKVLVIIPAYNEAECILTVVANVRDAGYPLIVVNDGSSDTTLDICKEHDIPVLDLCVNLGIGGAVQAGHKYALANGYEFDVQFDGDGQHDASYIDRLIAPLEKGTDLVIGSRFWMIRLRSSSQRSCAGLGSCGWQRRSDCLRGRRSPIRPQDSGHVAKMPSSFTARSILQITLSQSR